MAQLRDASVEAARVAAEFVREKARDRLGLDVREKQAADFVSEVDTGAETRIRDVLSSLVPGAAVVGEELSPTASMAGDTVFVVDPLDGTTNFLHGIPLFCISIGLERDGQLVAGVVYNPISDEMFTAEKGKGAYLNDRRRLRVAARRDLADAVIATGIPHRGRPNHPGFLKEIKTVMAEVAGIRRTGSAALDLAWTAAGRFDGYWERNLKPWDLAAGAVLVREAGGIVTDLVAPGEIADAVTALLLDHPRRRACGAALRRRVETYYTSGQAAAAYADLYQKLIRLPTWGAGEEVP